MHIDKFSPQFMYKKCRIWRNYVDNVSHTSLLNLSTKR